MGLLNWLFGSRSAEPDSPELALELRLLHSIQQQLLASRVPAADGVTVVERAVMSGDRRLAITVEFHEITDQSVHVHVVTWLPNPAGPGRGDSLNACVMGFGPLESAVEQAAEVWLRLVGAPILSYLSGKEVLDAAHFAGDEAWGIPGGHGFVGPLLVRGEGGEVDMSLLAQCEAFLFDGYPRDGRRHLAKVTLIGQEGRWTRHLEIDGHIDTHVDEDWQCAVPGPHEWVLCVRFAVFDMID